MTKTQYKSFSYLSQQQATVMEFINAWTHEKKTPVPQKVIIEEMKSRGISVDAVRYSLEMLLSYGYIRRGWTEKQNTTEYVQLRGI